MFESLQQLATGFTIASTVQNLLYCLIGCIVGTLIGVLPGLGPIAGIALLIPATFSLNPTSAIIMLAGIYYGAMYGGSTTSILLNVPGETASVTGESGLHLEPVHHRNKIRRYHPRHLKGSGDDHTPDSLPYPIHDRGRNYFQTACDFGEERRLKGKVKNSKLKVMS